MLRLLDPPHHSLSPPLFAPFKMSLSLVPVVFAPILSLAFLPLIHASEEHQKVKRSKSCTSSKKRRSTVDANIENEHIQIPRWNEESRVVERGQEPAQGKENNKQQQSPKKQEQKLKKQKQTSPLSNIANKIASRGEAQKKEQDSSSKPKGKKASKTSKVAQGQPEQQIAQAQKSATSNSGDTVKEKQTAGKSEETKGRPSKMRRMITRVERDAEFIDNVHPLD